MASVWLRINAIPIDQNLRPTHVQSRQTVLLFDVHKTPWTTSEIFNLQTFFSSGFFWLLLLPQRLIKYWCPGSMSAIPEEGYVSSSSFSLCNLLKRRHDWNKNTIQTRAFLKVSLVRKKGRVGGCWFKISAIRVVLVLVYFALTKWSQERLLPLFLAFKNLEAAQRGNWVCFSPSLSYGQATLQREKG